MSPTIEIVTERVTLGEGPHWDIPTQTLYYVDILGQTLHKYVPSTDTHAKVKIEGGPIGFAVPVEGKKDTFVIGLGRKIEEIVWDGVSRHVQHTKTLAEVDNEPGFTNNRFNDGKADPTGRLWAGTMGPEPIVGQLEPYKGTLYTLDCNQVKAHLKTISISNGLAWNVQLKKMYYIDSPLRTVDQFDYDQTKGEICNNKKVIFDFERNNIPGIPDGMTIDSDGNLWVAVFSGARLLKINPNTSELLTTIQFPAQQITSATFGGPKLEDLYVTSGQLVIDGQTQPAPAGAVFKVTGTGSKGLPCVNVKL